MEILLKLVCVVDEIASIAVLYWVDNFWPYKKHLGLLAKKVGLFTKNVSLRKLESRLRKIWKNQKSSKLRQLLDKNEDWFSETLQWAI